jgi:hypothetical protein
MKEVLLTKKESTCSADEAKPIAGLENASVDYLFPSPVMYFDWPASEELNNRLKKIILAMRIRHPGVVKTNRGGWQSDSDLETWPYPEIAELRERIIAFVREYVSRTLATLDKRHGRFALGQM